MDYKDLHYSYYLYRAKVAKVNEEDGVIHVIPYEAPVGTAPIVAYPPSFIPTSRSGSGVISLPKEHQECLVAHHKNDETHQILTYLTRAGIDPMGAGTREKLSPEETALKVGGFNKSKISIGTDGRINLFSNLFARISVDGSSNMIELGSRSYENYFSGGLVKETYFNEHPLNGIEEYTGHLEVYTDGYENPGFSDGESEENESVAATSVLGGSYVSKALVRAGGEVLNRKINDEIPERYPPYQIETRQSTGGMGIKDTVGVLRMGYADENFRFNKKAKYPAGTMFEILQKRNAPGNVGTFVMKYGLQGSDITGTDTGTHVPVQGEIYRLQVLQDITPTILGSVADPVGEGLGYSSTDTADLRYYESFGKLTSVLLEGDALKNTLWRKDISNSQIVSEERLGGPSMYTRSLTSDETVYSDIFTETSRHEMFQNGGFAAACWKDNEYTHYFEKASTVVHDKLTVSGIYQHSRLDTTHAVSEHNVINQTQSLTLTLGEKVYSVILSEDNIEIKCNTGGKMILTDTQATVEMGNSSVTIADSKVTIDSANIYLAGETGSKRLLTEDFLSRYNAHTHKYTAALHPSPAGPVTSTLTTGQTGRVQAHATDKTRAN